MTDNADDVARGIVRKFFPSTGDLAPSSEFINAIAAALRKYGDERAIKQLKVDQIYLDAERKKADAEGYRRGVEDAKTILPQWSEGSSLCKEKKHTAVCHYETAAYIRRNLEELQRGDRQGGVR